MPNKINLVGQRFNRLLVIEEAGRDKWSGILWSCLCDCGIVKMVLGNSLRRGKSKSCGCLNREITSETNKINLTGQHFSRLLVLKEVGKNKRGYVMWKCRCDCGTERIVCSDSLRSGNTKSCGCLNIDRIIERNYNPNLTDAERQIRREYPEYLEWRTSVYERDNYTCQCCGDNKGGNLCAHHKNGYDNFPELRTTLGNGVTVCENCHGNFHHRYGKGNNTETQWEEFLRAQ